MSAERIEGAAQKAVGSVKDAVGKATGNDSLRAEGMKDKVVGSAKNAVGKAEDAVNREDRKH